MKLTDDSQKYLADNLLVQDDTAAGMHSVHPVQVKIDCLREDTVEALAS